MTLEDGARAYAAAHPKTDANTSWEDECGKLTWDWSASYTPGWATHGDITTAMHAMANSTIISKNPADIIPGRYVFLSLPGSADGHVGQCVAGQGPTALIFWATNTLTEPLGAFIGFGTVANYEKVRGAKFLGVSNDYAGALPNLAAFAIDAPTDGEEAMTDILYYADPSQPVAAAIPSGPNKGLIVALSSMWYQECPGAPLYPLTGNQPYNKGAWLIEYEAFLARNTKASVATGIGAFQDGRYATPAQTIADLILLRGQTSQPIGNFGGSATSGVTKAQVQAISDASDKNVIAKIPTKLVP